MTATIVQNYSNISKKYNLSGKWLPISKLKGEDQLLLKRIRFKTRLLHLPKKRNAQASVYNNLNEMVVQL